MRLSAQATLAQSYFQVRTLDELKRLLDDEAAAFKNILDRTKNRYASGVASRNDIALAETQYKNTQAQAIDLGVLRAQMEHAIATLIGKPASTFSIPAAPLALKVPAIPAGVPSELLERRPDIAAAERNMAAANAQIGVALAAYYPTITLSATGGFEASDRGPVVYLAQPLLVAGGGRAPRPCSRAACAAARPLRPGRPMTLR